MIATATTELLQAPSAAELELATFTVGDDPTAEARLGPISAATGSPNTLVYLEVDPGKQIPLSYAHRRRVFVVLDGERHRDLRGPAVVGVGGLHRGRPGVRAARLGEHGVGDAPDRRASSARTSS